MLHCRYQAQRKKSCPIRSQEIDILKLITTNDKSNMPEYLKYRDRGYMYTPHSSFISFFMKVDDVVREVVNPVGFQQYAQELVKAS